MFNGGREAPVFFHLRQGLGGRGSISAIASATARFILGPNLPHPTLTPIGQKNQSSHPFYINSSKFNPYLHRTDRENPFFILVVCFGRSGRSVGPFPFFGFRGMVPDGSPPKASGLIFCASAQSGLSLLLITDLPQTHRFLL